MTQRLLMVNPNSSETVTQTIREASELEGVACQYLTLQGAPKGIETDAHVEAVIPLLEAVVEAWESRVDAMVLACFSDPGLRRLSEHTETPVLGIGRSAYEEAMAYPSFGVISIVPESIPRHRRYLESLGLSARLAGDRPLNMGVAELEDGARVAQRLVEVGRLLVARDGAHAVVLGCAGLARHRATLEDTLGVAVIDPVQAAVRAACKRLAGAPGDPKGMGDDGQRRPGGPNPEKTTRRSA